MNQQILRYLKDYSYDTWDVNRLLVSSFLRVNNISGVQNKFIQDYIIFENDGLEYSHQSGFIKLFTSEKFGIEDLIELFEFVISPLDKEVNGAIYTPEYIRRYIVDNALLKKHNQNDKHLADLIFGDIACGCGGFFKTIVEVLKNQTDKSYFEIFSQNIFGLDIQEYSIVRTKILLCLIAITDNEDRHEFNFNLYSGDALDFDWKISREITTNAGFDIIVGNPPYVGVTKMTSNTRILMKKWNVSLSGKPDLYIPFFEIGLQNLAVSGVLGYITVNTFFKSLNGRLLRAYFSSRKFDLMIADFGGEQVFKNRSTYTCICIICKEANDTIKYLKTDSHKLNKIKTDDFALIRYDSLDDFEGWHLVESKRTDIISKIEKTGISLGDRYLIRNGFATLQNNIYVFTPIRESLDNYYFEKDNKEYKIEKGICRNTIKPNTLKNEAELLEKMEKLIFPYSAISSNNDLFGKPHSKLEIFPESKFKIEFPLAYKYLEGNKKLLAKRDRGNKKYEKWYAFGRNQALTLVGNKLLFPYISDHPCFVFTDEDDLLFYNGYAIFSEYTEELLILKKILMSKIFWFYIKNTSKPYSGNFFSTAKNYVKNFGVCDLTLKQKHKLLSLTDTDKIDSFLEKIYDIRIA
jgi:adenine-specific DNA-methyltransferase